MSDGHLRFTQDSKTSALIPKSSKSYRRYTQFKMSMDYRTAMATLREMFPKHSEHLIDQTLRECGGALESTISRLLRARPDLDPHKGHQHKSHHSDKPAAPRETTPDHIFPPDFLRWPADVEWVKVSSDAFGAPPLQTDDDVIVPGAPLSEVMGQMQPEHAIQMGTFDAGQQQSGWSKLKSKFMTMGSSYSHI